jgi:hypothetical protein
VIEEQRRLILMHTGVCMFMAHLAWQHAQALHAIRTDDSKRRLADTQRRRLVAVEAYNALRLDDQLSPLDMIPVHQVNGLYTN